MREIAAQESRPDPEDLNPSLTIQQSLSSQQIPRTINKLECVGGPRISIVRVKSAVDVRSGLESSRSRFDIVSWSDVGESVEVRPNVNTCHSSSWVPCYRSSPFGGETWGIPTHFVTLPIMLFFSLSLMIPTPAFSAVSAMTLTLSPLTRHRLKVILMVPREEAASGVRELADSESCCL